MNFIAVCRICTLALAVAFSLAQPAPVVAAVPEFSFVQASDVHTPLAQSRETIARIKALQQIPLALYGITAPAPSFAIVTGDLTEFGGGNGWWAEYLSSWKGCRFPVHNVLGNHDNTWRANVKSLRELGTPPCYSFTASGCRFIGLMSATIEDPRPSISEEQIVWLRQVLASAGRQTPVFVFFHHPLGGSEFASRYDYDRLLDLLREHNTVLLLAGHSHGHVYRPVEDLDQVTGGSTFGPNAGFAVYSIKSGRLRAAYWKAGEDAPGLKLLEKTIPATAPYPGVEIASPSFRKVVGDGVQIQAQLEGVAQVQGASFTVDDEAKGDLKITGKAGWWVATGALQTGELLPGAHYLRVEFRANGKTHCRSTEFVYESPSRPTAWRTYLGASTKVTPRIAEGVIYVGANDGRLRALDAQTGALKWEVPTGAEILGQPLTDATSVYAANGLGEVFAVSKAGKKIWSFTAGDAVYSAPVGGEGQVIFGCNDGTLHALDARTGKELWVNRDAQYAVESTACVRDGRVFYGAWDQYVRCVDARDGKLLWKKICEGARRAKAAKRYYSPGDAAPVVCEGRLLIADRHYLLSIYDAASGELVGSLEKVAACGLSEDGKFVYLRQTDGNLTKVNSAAKTIWTVPAQLGAIPTAPVEKNGVVYVAGGTGLVSARAAATGKLLWQYQVSPKLFVMSSIAADGTNAYATAFDGSVTAIQCSPSKQGF